MGIPLFAHADTIAELALDIARTSPEAAEKAMRIAELARDLDTMPDRGAVKDAIEFNAVDSDLSDPRIQSATSAVLATIERGPGRA